MSSATTEAKRTVALLVAGSPNAAFYSQLAALNYALTKLAWSRWHPRIHLYLGGDSDGSWEAWRPYLRDIEIAWVSPNRYARQGEWAQSDDVFRIVPVDADVLITMDADVLPVAAFEPVLDRIVERGVVGGTIAHFPPPGSEPRVRESWERMAEGLIDTPLTFPYLHSLDEHRKREPSPFYVNFAAVFFPGPVFQRISARYLELRPVLETRMEDGDFSGQVALSLALLDSGATNWALPMRFNFPNDPIAERMYPRDLEHVAIFHYLRVRYGYDRHKIFANPAEYRRFLDMPLEGVHRAFQQHVRRIFGDAYPFPSAAPAVSETM